MQAASTLSDNLVSSDYRGLESGMLKQEVGTANDRTVHRDTNFFPEMTPKNKQQRNKAVNIFHFS